MHIMHKFGSKIRILPNGHLAIPRKNAELEMKMDREFQRVDQLEWRPVMRQPLYRDMPFLIQEFGKADEVYILGKGATLDIMISKLDKPIPIIGINDAAWAAQQEYPQRNILCVCQDAYDQMKIPRAPFGFVLACEPIVYRFADHECVWSFTPATFGLRTRYPTIGYALYFARMIGAKKAYMVGFDAIRGDYSYSRKAGHERNFKFGLKTSHAGVIEQCKGELEIEFLWPGLPEQPELRFDREPEANEPEADDNDSYDEANDREPEADDDDSYDEVDDDDSYDESEVDESEADE